MDALNASFTAKPRREERGGRVLPFSKTLWRQKGNYFTSKCYISKVIKKMKNKKILDFFFFFAFSLLIQTG